MSAAGTGPGWAEFDTFRTAVVLGWVSAALALALPFLTSLVVALAGLAGAGWVSGRARGNFPARSGARAVGGWLSVAGGIVGFVVLSAPWSAARGLCLAVAFLPLWIFDRCPTPPTG